MCIRDRTKGEHKKQAINTFAIRLYCYALLLNVVQLLQAQVPTLVLYLNSNVIIFLLLNIDVFLP